MDRTYEYSFSLYLPKDFPIVDIRLVIAQWKQVCEWFGCHPPNPVLAIRYSRGELFVTRRDDEGQTRLYTSRGEMRGRWLDFRFAVRFSQKENGFGHAAKRQRWSFPVNAGVTEAVIRIAAPISTVPICVNRRMSVSLSVFFLSSSIFVR